MNNTTNIQTETPRPVRWSAWLGDGEQHKTMETRTKEKKATVCKDRAGYWVAIAHDTDEKLGGLHNTELDAYKAANRAGYIVA